MDQTQKLRDDYECIKVYYIKLINDRDVLLHWGKPQLEALYAAKIGVWQLECLHLELQIKSLQLKIEMISAALNTGSPIDIQDIEMKVALKLAQAEEQIILSTHQLANAKDLLTHLASPQRSAELRHTYRTLAKQLHPDANPNLPDHLRQLWYTVVQAYDAGDLEQLKAMHVLYDAELAQAAHTEAAYTSEELSLIICTLKEGARTLEEEIKNIKENFPFTFEEKIKDEDWVANEVSQLQQKLERLKQYEQKLELKYQTILTVI